MFKTTSLEYELVKGYRSRSLNISPPIQRYVSYRVFLPLVLILMCSLDSQLVSAKENGFDWKSDWALEEGFRLSVDTQGYQLPTAIAFVPNPGSGPKDPLYFVTELRGKVKVVTNDRSVYTFAENFFKFSFAAEDELSSTILQFGIAGICLEPKHGYVFVTFAYQDSSGILRNNIARFQSKPETFSITTDLDSMVTFTDLFLPYESGIHHQIGPCQVDDDLVYVGVGDAYQPFEAQNTNSLLGKIIRMTLDGRPVRRNPFYVEDREDLPANYVWAYGFRNPFSLKIVQGRVFAADNGNDTDKFLKVDQGENSFWDGDNRSFAMNADFVFIPSIGPVQMDYYPQGSSLFPTKYRQMFFLAASATVEQKVAGIVTLDYGLAENKLLSMPEFFVKYRGPGDKQSVVGLAFGPDGLYFVPILPNKVGNTFILKVAYDPTGDYPFRLTETENTYSRMIKYGCMGCHRLTGQKSSGGDVGPSLGPGLVSRISRRLSSEMYLDRLKELNYLEGEPFRSYRAARQELVDLTGMEQVRTWMKYHLMEPRFDNPHAQMPNFGFSDKEALKIADYLIAQSGEIEGWKQRIGDILPNPIRIRHLFLFSFGGFFLAICITTLPRLLKLLGNRRRV